MSQQYQEKKQLSNANGQSNNGAALVLNQEEIESLEPIELQALQGNAHLASGVGPEAATLRPASNAQAPWNSNIFSSASDSIRDVEWTTQTGSNYTLDGGVRTEHTHNPYALPDEKILYESPAGKVTMQNTADVEYYSGSSATLGREGVRESSRSINTGDQLIQEERQLTNRIDGTLNHDSEGISGGSSAQLGYADKITVVSGDAAQNNGTETNSLVNERSRRIDGNFSVTQEQGARQIAGGIEGGYSRASITTSEDAIKTVEHGVESQNQVSHFKDAEGNTELVVGNTLAGSLGHSTQRVNSENQVVTNKVYTKGNIGQETTLSGGERSTDIKGGIDIGGSVTTEHQEGNQNISQTNGFKFSGTQTQNLQTDASVARAAASGTRSTTVVEDIDAQNQLQNTRAHEGTVFVQKSTDEQGEEVRSVGTQYGYTRADVAVSKDNEGNVTSEKSEWKTKNQLSATEKQKISASGSLSHETSVGRTNVDGSSSSESVTDALSVKGSTGDQRKLDGSSAQVQLSRTFADKTESVNELNENVVRSNNKTIAIDGNIARDKEGQVTKSVGFSKKDQRVVETTHADGSTTRDKAINQASIDSRRSLSVSTEREHVENIKKENLDSHTTLTTEQGKSVLKGGASTVIDENGQRKYMAEGSASYTAYEQTIKHTIDPLAKKLDGLKLGDRDVDGEDRVRMLQRALKADGANLVEDGVFGASTKSALEAFQTKHNLEATGIVNSATAELFPRIGLLQHGATMSAGWHVGKADASLKGEAQFDGDQIKVKGVAGAKVTIIGGNAKIEVPAIQASIGGERVQAVTTVGVNAAVLAEVNGTVELDVDKSDGVNVGVSGDLKAFAGAKAGVEIGAELRWMRNSASHYGEMLNQYAKSLPGTWDDMLVDKIPTELWPQFANLLVGTGPSRVAYAKAGVEGSAGIGAEGKLNAGLKDGMIEVSGKIGATFGLGAGIKTNVGLHAVDGVRLIGVLGVKGMNWLTEAIPEAAAWLDQVIDEIQVQTDNYLENEKRKGGWSGFAAGAVDFLGDNLLNLW